MSTHNSISLSALTRQIRDSINSQLPDYYWIVAEISELKENWSGHCYLELIEKKANADAIVAKANGIIWSAVWRMLKPYFSTTTGIQLEKGMKVLLKVSVDYHEVYGLSLNIRDIDPAYTLGEMAIARQMVINKLISEGVFEMNQNLEFPLVPQRIAVISSKTAAGFGDFCKHLEDNSFGFKFSIKLFPALVQGNEAANSIISALEIINNQVDKFDCLVIIRGGGSRTDLACFDDYRLALHVAQFPLPVITGIGHEQDDSVTDLVAHTRLKTPTAVADFLIQALAEADANIDLLQSKLIESVKDLLNNEKRQLDKIASAFPTFARSLPEKHKALLLRFTLTLPDILNKRTNKELKYIESNRYNLFHSTQSYLQSQKFKLNKIPEQVNLSTRKNIDNQLHKIEKAGIIADSIDPKHVLARGYSITQVNGKIIKSSSEITVGEHITTILFDGSITSEVEEKSDNK
jgi:exodeoxyribonuclease VII large subunit